MAVGDVLLSQSFPERQTELKAAILSGTDEKVKRLLESDPRLTNAPFANGKLPLHVALLAHQDTICRTILLMFADPLAKDDQNLDAFDHASIAGNEGLAEAVLKSINPGVPTIAEELFAIGNKDLTLKRECKHPIQFPLKKTITSHDLDAFLESLQAGADFRTKTEDDKPLFLSHLALQKGEVAILHKLLLIGADPNEKDKKGKTLLTCAASLGNMHAAYLLMAYGAVCTQDDLGALMSVAKSHDPLYISRRDKMLFAAGSAYWLAKGLMGPSILPELIPLAAGAWSLYDSVSPTSNSLIWAAGLAGLELMPATNVTMQMVRTASLAFSAFTGIKAAYQQIAQAPAAAGIKCFILSANALQSMYLFTKSIGHEYSENELIKSLSACHNVTTDDITHLEQYSADSRMFGLPDNPQAYGCQPVLERAFPGWNCNTYKALFRRASRARHPDKAGEKSSSIQMILNQVNLFFKERCPNGYFQEIRDVQQVDPSLRLMIK